MTATTKLTRPSRFARRRRAILRLLAVDGPATVAQLAAELERYLPDTFPNADAVRNDLRALAEQGLVLRSGFATTARWGQQPALHTITDVGRVIAKELAA